MNEQSETILSFAIEELQPEIIDPVSRRKNRKRNQRKQAKKNRTRALRKQAAVEEASKEELEQAGLNRNAIECRLKHLIRRRNGLNRNLRGYTRFTRDDSARLDEESKAIMLENEHLAQLMQDDVDRLETSQFIMMGNELIDLDGDDENELTGCMSEYDDLERHERELDKEFGELLSA